MPGERATISDWANHISTIFPEVRLKRYLEMRGADVGSAAHIVALPAFWVGLMYDQTALDAAWDLVKGFDAETREGLRVAASVSALDGAATPGPATATGAVAAATATALDATASSVGGTQTATGSPAVASATALDATASTTTPPVTVYTPPPGASAVIRLHGGGLVIVSGALAARTAVRLGGYVTAWIPPRQVVRRR